MTLEGKAKRSAKKRNPRLISLLDSCEEFLKHQIGDLDKVREVGENLANKLTYTKNDLAELCVKIEVKTETHQDLGFYISALANKLLTTEEEKIILAPKAELKGLGAYLQKGLMVINGNTGVLTGAYMEGGILLVNGKTPHDAGYCMRGGIIMVANDNGLEMYTGNKLVKISIPKWRIPGIKQALEEVYKLDKIK